MGSSSQLPEVYTYAPVSTLLLGECEGSPCPLRSEDVAGTAFLPEAGTPCSGTELKRLRGAETRAVKQAVQRLSLPGLRRCSPTGMQMRALRRL